MTSCDIIVLCGISNGFPLLSPSLGQVAHALLARSPLSPPAQHSAPKSACAMLLVYRVMLELSLSHDAAGCFSFAGFPALSAEQMDPVRLACVRHAASVRPEPGSNPQINYLKVCLFSWQSLALLKSVLTSSVYTCFIHCSIFNVQSACSASRFAFGSPPQKRLYHLTIVSTCCQVLF